MTTLDNVRVADFHSYMSLIFPMQSLFPFWRIVTGLWTPGEQVEHLTPFKKYMKYVPE